MNRIEDILLEWEKDSNIDENNLDKSAISTSKLHSKYLNILTQSKLKITKIKAEYAALKHIKLKYYRGEMNREELAEYGWEQYDKLVLKTAMDEVLSGDKDLSDINIKLEYMKIVIEAVETIMSQLKARDWSIKNAISWKQFIAGN